MSPHIERLTERFRDENGEIGWEELEELLSRCHVELIKGGHSLSFYEFLFYAFCSWAHKKNPEYLLLEVGLGGRLDAVNIFAAELVLLPSISRDHQEFLGRRYEQILGEKLAVVRPEKTLISYLDLKYLREKSSAVMKAVGAKVVHLEDLKLYAAHDFSARNQLLAYAASRFLAGEELSFQNWTPETASFEHRGEVISEKRQWHFFGSHNVDGMRKLIQFLHSLNYNFSGPPFDVILVTFSRRDSMEIRTMARMLKSAGLGKVMMTSFPHPKAVSKDELLTISRQEGLEFVDDPLSTIEAQDVQRVLVTGSYYFLGHFKSLLRGR